MRLKFNNILPLISLTLVTIGLFACNASPASPTPDLVATEVAVQKAALATLTAAAPTPESPTPAAQATSELLPTDTPQDPGNASASCTIVSNVNLRNGPGTVYQPPLGVMAAGTEVTPLAFSPIGYPGGSWVQIQATDQNGWLSADPQYISCNIALTALPLGAAPPTPTPPPAPQIPTPTRPLFAVVPVDGADDNDYLQGRRIILPDYSPEKVTIPPVFRDKVAFRVEAYDIRFGNSDGAGIKTVNITIRDENDNIVHQRLEQNAGYCAFGGGEPDCNVWIFADQDYRWPEGQPIANNTYRVTFDITPQDGQPLEWRWSFIVNDPNAATFKPGLIEAEIVQTGVDSTSPVVTHDLVFQVKAFHAGYGDSDGDGIAYVDMAILDDQGNLIHQRREQNAGYCAFGGGEPDCNIQSLDQVEPGVYTLRAIIYAQDGQIATVETDIEIQ
jgi:hypothetical protein